MQKTLLENNAILKLSFDFSLMIIKCSELLDEEKYVINKQILRAGTSICANATEAQNAESKSDFIHKMKIAVEEADDTRYLLLCDYAEEYPDCKDLFLKLEEIQKVLNKIMGTAKK